MAIFVVQTIAVTGRIGYASFLFARVTWTISGELCLLCLICNSCVVTAKRVSLFASLFILRTFISISFFVSFYPRYLRISRLVQVFSNARRYLLRIYYYERITSIEYVLLIERIIDRLNSLASSTKYVLVPNYS